LIMKRVWKIVLDDRHEMEHGVAHTKELEFFNMDGSFVSDYTDHRRYHHHRLRRTATYPPHRRLGKGRISNERYPI